MNADTSLQTFKASRSINDLFYIRIRFIETAQIAGGLKARLVFFALFEAILERRIATHHDGWHQLGNLVAQSIWESENSCRVANSVTSLDGAKGDDLGNMVATIFFRRITDHFIAVARVEVHVDVGHRTSTWVQEAFKQQVIFNWIKVSDLQRICHCATGG